MPDRFIFTVTGGTGDFATANGGYTVYHTLDCGYQGDLGDWTAGFAIGGSAAGATLTGPGGAAVVFDGSASDCCTPGELIVTSSTGTGTTPDPLSPITLGSCTPCPIVEISGCPDRLLNGSFDLTFQDGTGDCSPLDGTVVHLLWNGTDKWTATLNLGGATDSLVEAEYDPAFGVGFGAIKVTITGDDVAHGDVFFVITDCDPLTIDLANFGSWNPGCTGDVNGVITGL
jgi:hypothetical protein